MLKNIFIIWIILLGYYFIVLNDITFANSEDIYWDCNKSTIWWYKEYTNIFPKELISLAEKNLQQYCCRNKKSYLTNEKTIACENNKVEYYIDSPRLYDHLVDIGMRYIDWDYSLQYPDSNGNIILDKKWKERREYITKYWESINGRVPLELQQKFWEYRGNMIEDFEINASNNDFCDLESTKKRFWNNNDSRNTTTSLSKKFFVICELSSCIAENKKNNRIEACQSLATKRISGERNYVQWLLLYQSTLSLSTNFEAYALGYINHDMFNNLLKKIVMMSKWLWFVNNKVNEITKVCSA